LAADVTPLDNSGRHKAGVSRTYKGHYGYAPMAVYLGQEGYCLEFELREGKQHCQKETSALLETALQQAAVDFLIKWNPRKQDKESWLQRAEQHGHWEYPREGKRIAVFSMQTTRQWQGYEYTVRQVIRITERTIDKHGQVLLMPMLELEGWWTSLALSEAEIIQRYADHGTSEPFHSEFKTDLDSERLPSGKFATNALVMGCSVLTYNSLRWIGQNGLVGSKAPRRHKAKRRRIKTVMQELMSIAVRVIKTAQTIKLSFGKGCRSFDAFE